MSGVPLRLESGFMESSRTTPVAQVVVNNHGDLILDEPEWRECGCSEMRINPWTRDIMECESAAGCDCACECHELEVMS